MNDVDNDDPCSMNNLTFDNNVENLNPTKAK